VGRFIQVYTRQSTHALWKLIACEDALECVGSLLADSGLSGFELGVVVAGSAGISAASIAFFLASA